MAPFFNAESSELHDEQAEAELAAERDQQQREARTARERIGLGPTPAEPKPGGSADSSDPAASPWMLLTPEAATARYDTIRAAVLADPTHPLHDARSPDHERAVAEWIGLQMRMTGGNPDDPEENRELLEAHGWRSRAPGSAAPGMDLAALPAAPEGHAWDPNTHQALAALGDDTPLARDAIAAGYTVVAQAQEMASRGVAPDELTWERPLTEHWGPNHDERVEQAAYALELLAADDEPAIQRAAQWLGALWEWDARVVIFLADRVYPALRDGNPGPLVTEMLLRNGERWAQGQAAGKARAAKAATAAETPADRIVSTGGRP